MTPTLYAKGEKLFQTNGIGRLSDAISCVVTEELNGGYELELEYPVGGRYANDVVVGNIILATHDDSGNAQPFRIYQAVENISGRISVLAQHISYDLSRITIMPYTAASTEQALSRISENAVVDCPFTFSADFFGRADYATIIPQSAKSILGGDDSILSVYGGEYKYDKFAVSLLARRGEDKPISIRYAKNMTKFESTSTLDTYNAVVPFYRTQSGVITCQPPVMFIGAYTEAVPLDLSDQFDYVPEPSELGGAALDWLRKNKPWIPQQSIDVSFVELWKTENYKNVAPLQSVELGDGVNVFYPDFNVDVKLRVVKTSYDSLAERYTELTLGKEKQTVVNIIADIIQKSSSAQNTARENGEKADSAQNTARENARKIKELQVKVADLQEQIDELKGQGGNS